MAGGLQVQPLDFSGVIGGLALSGQIRERQRRERQERRITGAQTAGTIVGALAGGALGSVVPGAGTLAGASIGAGVGSQLGGALAGGRVNAPALVQTGLQGANLLQRGNQISAFQSALNPQPQQQTLIDPGTPGPGFDDPSPISVTVPGQVSRPAVASALAGLGEFGGAASVALGGGPDIQLVKQPNGQFLAVDRNRVRGGQTLGPAAVTQPDYSITKNKRGDVLAVDKNNPRTPPITVSKADGGEFGDLGSSEKVGMIRFLTKIESDLANGRPVTPERQFIADNFRRILEAPQVVGTAATGFSQIQRPPLPQFGGQGQAPAGPLQPQAAPQQQQPGTTVTPLSAPTPKPLGFTDAAKFAATEQALETFQGASAKIVNPDGSINRGLIAAMDLNAPFSQGRQVNQEIKDAIEARIRAESGAAVPESEIKRAALRFIPTTTDSDAAILSKLKRGAEFFQRTLKTFSKGRSGAPEKKESPAERRARLNREFNLVPVN